MFHSVRSRLTLWYTAILGLVLITFGSISYLLLAREIRAATDESIADTGREFAAAFSNDPTGVKLDFRFTERIAVQNERDELGYLATTLNDLLERLQRVFDSQKRFMADASHELRTPLSIIQGEADVALARRDRSAEEYRQSVEVMQKAALK